MRKLLVITVLFTALVGFSLAGCQSSAKRCGGACAGKGCATKQCGTKQCAGKATATACQACAKGKAGEATWCESCKVGYVDSKKVACKSCYLAKTGGPACAHCAAKAN